MAIAEKLIDKRLIDRYTRKGLLDPKEYQRVLNKLPDRSDNIWKPDSESSEETSDKAEGRTNAETDQRASDRVGSQRPAL